MGGSRRVGSAWAGRVAVATVLAVALSVGVPPGALPKDGGFPLSWLWSWLRQAPGWSAPAVPVQPSGGPVGGDHYVPAEATRARSGSGRPAGSAPGALPAEEEHRPVVRQGTTPTLPGDHSFDPARSKRVAAAASATSDVYSNMDGSFTRLVYPVPVNYRASDGTFRPIDRHLVRGGDGRWRQTAGGLDLSFGATASADGVASVRLDGDRSLGFSLAGASTAAAVTSGDEVAYAGALPGIDLRMRAGPTGVRQAVVLHSATAAASWLMPLNLGGLKAAVDSAGSAVFSDPTGTARVVMPSGYADDSRFEPRTGGYMRTHDVTYQLTTVEGQPALRVSVDDRWLRDPARVFPVTVTVAVQVDRRVDDTYVLGGGGGGQQSAESELVVGTTGAAVARSFVGFGEVDPFYGAARLSTVSLRMFNTWAADCAAKPVWVYPMTGAWQPSTVTGKAVPSDRKAALGWARTAEGPACTNTSGKPGGGTWLTADLKPQMFRDKALTGLALVGDDSDPVGGRRFASADSASSWPYLRVTYAANIPPQVDYQYPPSGHVAHDTALLLMARGHDPDQYPNPRVNYLFTVFDKNGAQIANSGWIEFDTWYISRETRLRWGETYLWTAAVGDGYLASTNQTVNVFTVQTWQSVNSGLSQHGGRGFDPNVGNYTTSATDAVVATVGPALAIQRSYNSLDLRWDLGFGWDTAFGAGWSSLLDSRARAHGVTVRVRYPNGQESTFGKNWDGTFSPPPGRSAALTGNDASGYQMVDKDGTTYRFTISPTAQTGWAWGISSVTDAAGRALTVGYNGAGLPDSITSASGRQLRLTWSTPAGATRAHVATVSTDPVTSGDAASALIWTYSYDGDRLLKVCPPTSGTACTSYSYGTGSLYPHAVRNAGARSYWRLNELSGTVAASGVAEHLGTDNGSYTNVALGQPGPLAGTASTAAGFNGTSSSVSLPGQLLGTATFKSVQLWFKANPGDKGVLFGYSVDPITNTTTGGGYVPALYIGTSGKLYGSFWPIPQIVSTTAVNDGRWHHVLLMVDNGVNQQMVIDGTFVNPSTGGNGVVDFGQRYAYVGAGFTGGGWPDNPFTGQAPQRNYFKGSIAEVALYDRALFWDDEFYNTQSELDAAATRPAALMTSVVRPSGNPATTIAYDGVSGRVGQVTDQHGGVWRVSAPVASGSSQVYVGSVLSGGPSDYWRLAEGAGVVDAVNQVNGNTATYNAVTLGVTGGPFGDTTVGSFNPASQSHLILPAADVPNTGPWSISMWFKTTAAGPLFGYEGGGGWVPALYIGVDGKLRGHFWINNMSAIMTSPGAVTNGAWHHVALTTSGSSQSLYLDGARVGNPVNAALQTVYADRAWVGKARWEGGWPQRGGGQYGFFNGQIAEVAVFHGQLSDKQIEAQHAARGLSAGAPASTVTVTDPTNKTLKYVYDLPGGRKVAEVDFRGGKTQYGYDTGGFLRTVTDPNGNVTTTEHDVRGNTVSSTTCQDRSANKCSTAYYTYYPDATTRLLTPDPRNDVMLTVRDGRSASATDNTFLTTHAYDVKGNRVSVTDPLGRVTTTAYTDGTTVAAQDGGFAPAGLPSSVTTPGGAVQTVVYFRSGDVARITDPAGKVSTFSYDGVGRALTKTETTSLFPGGLTTRHGYDKLGRVVSQTHPAVTNRVTGAVHTPVMSMVFDADGLLSSQTVSDTTGGDAARSQSWTYNTRGQRATETDPAGKTTSFGYDAYGNLVQQTDPDATVTRTGYDADGRLLTSTLVGWTGDPNNPSPPTDLVQESRAYDPAGRLASVTDAMGWVTSYLYTDNALTATVTRKDPSTGATFVLDTIGYDPAGHPVTKVTNGGATTTTASYDAAGRATSSTLDPAGLKRTTAYEYTRDDHVSATTLTDSAGTVVARSGTTYDLLGRPTARTIHNSHNPPVLRWRLNENGGTSIADSAGNAEGFASNVGWATDATRGPVATFNGTTSKVEVGGAVVDTTRPFSIGAWVKLNSKAANQFVLTLPGLAGSSAAKLSYQAGNDTWALSLGRRTPAGTTSWLTVASPAGLPQTGVWVHLAGTVDTAAGVAKLYVDGTERGSATSTVPFNNPADTMKVGVEFTSGWLHGSISDLQIYQHALSPTEVGQVKSGAAPAGGAGVVRTMWRRDTGGLVRSSTDPNGKQTDFANDEAGRVAVITRPAVQAETGGGSPISTRPVSYVGYDTFGAQVESKDPNGAVTTTAYDAAGRPVSTTLPSYTPPGTSTPIVATATRTYDSLGRVTASTDPLGKATSYTYDQLGRTAKVIAPNGGQTRYTYSLLGHPLSSTDATGALSTATYDFLGRRRTATQVVRQDSNAAHTTNYAYGGGGWLSSVQSPTGVTTSMTYNPAGERLSVKDGANNITLYNHDGAGRVVRTTLPDGTYSTTTYSLAGRPVSARSYDAANALLSTQSRTHDAAGNVTGIVDARGTQRSFGYDADGRQIWQVEPTSATDNIVTGFGYDVAGNRTRVTDGRGNAFVTTYNTWNLPQSRLEPATTAYPAAADRTFTATYDAGGRAVSLLAPGGVSATNTYDAVGNLTGQTGAGASVATADRTFGYDLAGRMTSLSGPGGTNTLTLDDRSLLRSTAGPSGAATFTYNPDGLMASRADAAGTTTYGYDGAGRLSTVANPSTGVQLTTGYNNLSQVNSITYGTNGNTRTFGYDGLHRLTADELRTPGGGSIAKIAYGYDANGNETSKTTTGFAGAASNTYTYDLANRLTSWSNGTTTTGYGYDKAGNRVQAGSKLFTYDQRNHLSTATGVSYTYTPRGTLASAGGVATAADAFNQVVSQAVSGGPAQTYTYDALGRVIRAGFAYTGLGNHLAADGSATYTRDPAGSVVGEASGTSQRLAWTDLHTDVVGQFTATGTALTGSTTYDPLGKILATLGMVGNLGYQSEWTDAFTGRVNMLARWYNTDTGQFDTRDTADLSPVPDSVNANRFAYANANPLTMTDPTGHGSIGAWFTQKTQQVTQAWNHVTTAVSSAWNTATSAVSAAWDWTVDRFNQAKNWANDKIDQAKQWVSDKWQQTRKNVAKTYQQTVQDLHKTLDKFRQAGQLIATATTRVVQQTVHKVQDAAKTVQDATRAAEQWIKDHKDLLIDIAAIGAGIAAGLACTVATAGVGALACMVGATALVNLARDAAKGNIHNWGDAFGSLGTGALTGLVGGAFGAAGGALVGAAAGKLGAVAAGVIGRAVGGAAAGAIGDIGTQAILNRGHIDWGSVGMAAGIGGVTGGLYRGSPKSPPRGGDRSPEPARQTADDAAPVGCRTHSFDPMTPVLMADRTTRPIKDVRIGDTVVATDPNTGTTTAKPVTALHANRDTDLTDVTVTNRSSGTNTTATLKTTQHHPFWDKTLARWVAAAALTAGHLLVTPTGSTETVITVRNHTGAQHMHDLTVADTHTYYVVAGIAPVLVHNCGDSVARHGPMNEGPLPEGVANTFRSGTYNATTSASPTTVYRAYGGSAREIGGFWSRNKPSGPVQSIVDSALDPTWGNSATRWVSAEIPAGTMFYEGVAAAQRGLVGGGNQIFVPQVDSGWITGGGTFG